MIMIMIIGGSVGEMWRDIWFGLHASAVFHTSPFTPRIRSTWKPLLLRRYLRFFFTCVGCMHSCMVNIYTYTLFRRYLRFFFTCATRGRRREKV